MSPSAIKWYKHDFLRLLQRLRMLVQFLIAFYARTNWKLDFLALATFVCDTHTTWINSYLKQE